MMQALPASVHDSYLLVQAKVWGIKARLIACIQGGQFAPERERHAAGIRAAQRGVWSDAGGLGHRRKSPELRQELIHASLSRGPAEAASGLSSWNRSARNPSTWNKLLACHVNAVLTSPHFIRTSYL